MAMAGTSVRADAAEAAGRVVFVDARGVERVVKLAWAATVPFEDGRMVRRIPSYRGQRHAPGRYWAATTGELVEYESHLECRWMTLLDFDPRVAAFVSQPLRLEATDAQGYWEHTPDLFARRDDGSAWLLDVKDPARIDRPEVQRQRTRTAAVCRTLGWDYDMVGAPPSQRWVNVAWLAGYRRPVHLGAELAAGLLERARRPVGIGDLLETTDVPELARPVLLHLVWRHLLLCDLDSGPLRDTTTVIAARAA